MQACIPYGAPFLIARERRCERAQPAHSPPDPASTRPIPSPPLLSHAPHLPSTCKFSINGSSVGFQSKNNITYRQKGAWREGVELQINSTNRQRRLNR